MPTTSIQLHSAHTGGWTSSLSLRRAKPFINALVWVVAFSVGVQGLAQEQAAPPLEAATSEAAAEQALPPPPAPETAPFELPDPPSLLLPANTVLELELVEGVSSKTNMPDDFFKMRVVIPTKVGDTILIPADTTAIGQVVHAQKSRGGGKAGELILAARYLEMPQGRIKLRSTFGAAGKDHTGASLGVAIAAGVFGWIVKGSEMELPAGSRLSAKTAEPVSIIVQP